MNRWILPATAATALLVAGGFAWTTYFSGGDLSECTAGAVAGGAIGGPFTLIDETGREVTDADVITKPTLVYFGYTFCPDVCPIDTQRTGLAIELLEEQGYDVGSLFISVDPDRDTPEVLASYTDNFHERMVGLTGTREQVDAAARAYKVAYTIGDQSDEYYLVDHTVQTYLMTPEEGFIDFFRRETSAEDMAARTACVIDALS